MMIYGAADMYKCDERCGRSYWVTCRHMKHRWDKLLIQTARPGKCFSKLYTKGKCPNRLIINVNSPIS